MTKIIREDDRIVVRPGRDLAASAANSFRAVLQELIKESPARMVIDLAGVTMVDSVGIGVIIAAHNSLGKNGGVLQVINVDGEIYNLFKSIRLDQHFTIQCAGPSGRG